MSIGDRCTITYITRFGISEPRGCNCTYRKYLGSKKKLRLDTDVLRAQSFTSLMEDLHQDINIVSSFSAGALMEHLREGIASLRHWYINPNEKSNKYKSSLLSYLTKVLMEHFRQGNIPLRHLLNAKPLFIS